MSSSAAALPQRTRWLHGIAVQARVIGAVLMRELHTRYGRDNIGYLWLVAEPLLLGSIIALLHTGQVAHDGSINAVALAVVGYCLFIMFRGIVNRSDGALQANLPLLYHKQVTVFDITFARGLLEAAGTFMSFLVLMSVTISLGYTIFPPRPLVLVGGVAYLFFLSLGVSMIITGGAHENKALERMVHPFTYFMIPLSGAFYQLVWVPQPYRDYLLYSPLPHIFELIRYGAFQGTSLEFVDLTYITAWVLVVNLIGLLAVRAVRKRIHLG